MGTVLRSLEHTMDPLIAAQVYNNRHCALTSLPQEILLHIIHNIEEDVPTLHSLQRTSRTFRRIITETANWTHMKDPFIGYLPASGTKYPYALPEHERDELAHRLRKDGMCDECRSAMERPLVGWFTRLLMWWLDKRIRGLPRQSRGMCRFGSWMGPKKLWCDACWREQDVHSFPVNSRGHVYWGTRLCLGWQGGVQLCEHVHIYWADIAAHVAKWQISNPGDW